MATEYPLIRYNVIITNVAYSTSGKPIKHYDRLIYNSPIECKTKSLPFRLNALIDFGVTNFDCALDLLHRYVKEHFQNGQLGTISIVKTTQTSKYCIYTSIVDTYNYQLLFEETSHGSFKIIRYDS